jgi:hypothetical protein
VFSNESNSFGLSQILSSKPGCKLRQRTKKLARALNAFIVNTLKCSKNDYYDNLSFEDVLKLKAFLSDINNIVTYRLTVALAKVLAASLPAEIQKTLLQSVNCAHPNASGFDLDINKDSLNLIGEVKGNIPTKSGNRFGPAQIDGLNNDVLQMFGKPPIGKGKTLDDPLPKKCKRKDREKAIKFLGLYSSQKTREATEKWITTLKKLANTAKWRSLKDCMVSIIKDPKNITLSELRCDTVYVIFLDSVE